MGVSHLLQTLKNGVRLIKFNRPEKKNAMTDDMYKTFTNILNEDAKNDSVVITIITGTGEYFSSGNDIKSAMEKMANLDENTTSDDLSVKHLVSAFINYPKVLIAVVNGPAIGIAATMTALCDVVYASETATFETPFVRLGLCAEACSSITFPQVLGRSKASEMLLFNHKLTAEEALQFNFVSKIIPRVQIDEFIEGLYKYGKLSLNNLMLNKALIMANRKQILCECNNRELDQLVKCFRSEDFLNGLSNFMSRKSKL